MYQYQLRVMPFAFWLCRVNNANWMTRQMGRWMVSVPVGQMCIGYNIYHSGNFSPPWLLFTGQQIYWLYFCVTRHQKLYTTTIIHIIGLAFHFLDLPYLSRSTLWATFPRDRTSGTRRPVSPTGISSSRRRTICGIWIWCASTPKSSGDSSLDTCTPIRSASSTMTWVSDEADIKFIICETVYAPGSRIQMILLDCKRPEYIDTLIPLSPSTQHNSLFWLESHMHSTLSYPMIQFDTFACVTQNLL